MGGFNVRRHKLHTRDHGTPVPGYRNNTCVPHEDEDIINNKRKRTKIKVRSFN